MSNLPPEQIVARRNVDTMIKKGLKRQNRWVGRDFSSEYWATLEQGYKASEAIENIFESVGADQLSDQVDILGPDGIVTLTMNPTAAINLYQKRRLTNAYGKAGMWLVQRSILFTWGHQQPKTILRAEPKHILGRAKEYTDVTFSTYREAQEVLTMTPYADLYHSRPNTPDPQIRPVTAETLNLLNRFGE